jgi:hypothetical protein
LELKIYGYGFRAERERSGERAPGGWPREGWSERDIKKRLHALKPTP